MTSIEFGQRKNPSWDALRVQTMNAIGGLLLDNPPSAGGGLQNKIYVWHSDGSTIDVFDPTQAGLIAALAAAVSGDTVWLPSIMISITSGVTVPAGVHVVGISDGAIINAASFSGTAITLSAGSALFGFTLVFVSNGTTAIGIDARVADATIEHVPVTVSGGSVSNVRYLIGASSSPMMQEIWTMRIGTNILWTTTDGSISSSPHWNTLAFPANYSIQDDFGLFGFHLQTDHLGHYLYLGGVDTANSNRPTIWQLTNLAAIRAAPATSPTWSVIAYAGQSTSAGTLAASGLVNLFYIRAWNDNLYLHADGIIGIYNGSTWAWKTAGGLHYHVTNGNVYAVIDGAAGDSYLRDWATDTAIGSAFNLKFGLNHFSEVWRRVDATNHYHFPIPKPDNHVYLREQITGTELDVTVAGSNNQDTTTVRGALTGDQIYCVDAVGGLRYSTNGLSFSTLVSWAQGWAMPTIMNGSGNLIWLLKSQTGVGNPIVRLYDTSGALLSNLTGDLWTVMGSPAGEIRFDNLQIVYVSSVVAGGYPIIADLHEGSASGTGALDVEVSGGAVILDAEFTAIKVDSGIAYVRDVAYTAQSGAGTIEPVQGDRGVWDALGYPARHTNDADVASTSLHHTLGTGADQAAPGNHAHSGSLSNALTSAHIFVGNGSNVATDVAMSNDATLANTGALTLATINGSPGTFGDATDIPQITVNGKGLVTSIVNIPVTFPAPVLSTYNETQTGDGSATVFYLANYAVPGTVRVYIDGILQPVTDDTTPSDVVTFTTPPAAGAVVTFSYDLEIV